MNSLLRNILCRVPVALLLLTFSFYASLASAAVSPDVSLGVYHSVALMPDGTVKTWGSNFAGQLGDGTTTTRSTPVTVTGLGGEVRAIATGGNHTVALMADGTLKAWGANESGQLGDGTTSDYSNVPVTVTGLGGPVRAIATAGSFTLALMADGTVKAWGNNDYGQLGDGTIETRLTPVTVAGLGGAVRAIAAGTWHTVALMFDGTVKAWGRGDLGQIGNGMMAPTQPTPVTVTGLGGPVHAIAAGTWYTVALMADGTVKAWGLNSAGQLGDGTEEIRSTPVTVIGLGGEVQAIAAGSAHTVALMADGTVKAWGQNNYGQLGVDTPSDYSSIPVTVTGLGGEARAIAAGYYHSVAPMTDGTVKAW